MSEQCAQKGFLSQYFDGVAIKRLSAVEADRTRSNQHEFNGTTPLRQLLGKDRLNEYPAHFMWLGGENEAVTEDSTVTWYDARENHETRTEYRLYFRNNPVMEMARDGDLLIVARRPDRELYFIVAPADSTIEQQLLWLFHAPDQIGQEFKLRTIQNEHDLEVDFVVRYILEELGIEVQEAEVDLLDTSLEPYIKKGFPSTREFSQLARSVAQNISPVSPVDDPDMALQTWIGMEERMFKRLERHLIAFRLEQGFFVGSQIDVDGFIEFSMKVHQRRKSRAGSSLENHLEEVFRANNVRSSRTPVTENKSRPDFLFPGIDEYRTESFPANRLTMLGVKSTCKDRWRQVLTEAARIKEKHLFTLEPGISEFQTEEMQKNNLKLVLPQRIHETYKPSQKIWLMNVRSFISLVSERQS